MLCESESATDLVLEVNYRLFFKDYLSKDFAIFLEISRTKPFNYDKIINSFVYPLYLVFSNY
jgi:hypothetical protein